MNDDQLREKVAQAIYEAEKYERMNLSMKGTVIEWQTLRGFQRDAWLRRATAAIDAIVLEVQDALTVGLQTDGAHQKQGCLWKVAETLGLSETLSEAIEDKGDTTLSDDINSQATEQMPAEEAMPDPPIPQPFRKAPSVATLLANHLDWLSYDVNAVNEHLTAANVRTQITLSAIKEQSRFVWISLMCVALLMLAVAVELGWMIYLLGVLVGHVR